MKSALMKPIPLQFMIACMMICYSCEQKPTRNTDESQIDSKSDTIVSSKMNNENEIDSKAEDNTGNRIQMSISPNTFSTSSIGEAKLIISNSSQDLITFGERYSIEYLNGQDWTETSALNNIAFTDMGYRMKPGNSEEYSIHLQPKPFDYKPGKYRINKEITLGRSPKTDKSINLYAEFVVE